MSARNSDLETRFVSGHRGDRPRPLWFWNGDLSAGGVTLGIDKIVDAGYSGFGIVPAYGMSEPFMSDAFLDYYAHAVDEAAARDLKVCLYDEFWFPSGSAGGAVARQAPDMLGKRLDMHEIVIAGPTRYSKPLPAGRLMSAVAMNRDSKERLDLRSNIKDGWLRWDVPSGWWQVMFFTCVVDGAKGLIDYLDAAAVQSFISLTYARYYERLAPHFGSTIDVGFYDEPTFHWIEGGRAWTPEYNTLFLDQTGEDPTLLYPALWYDIGEDTAAARNALLGMRADLFAAAFVKQLNDWCNAHNILLTGHVDQEEIANPVGLCGDLMKVFRHQDIPAFDQIFAYGRARPIAKVVSSAAANLGRPRVVCECYGATEGLDTLELYREAIDLYGRGTTELVPHAVWYDRGKMEFPPHLLPEEPDFGRSLYDFNVWAGRIQGLLARGAPAYDVAVLYPIETLQAEYRFGGDGEPYLGGPAVRGTSYLDLGEQLITELHQDFVFVHPDDLSSWGALEFDVFRLLILPELTTISTACLDVVREFHDRGGAVIATRYLPEHSTGGMPEDTMVRRGVEELFESSDNTTRTAFLSDASTSNLRRALERLLPVSNVMIDKVSGVDPASLSCLHRRLPEDVYYFGNSSDGTLQVQASLVGRHDVQMWDPATGDISGWAHDGGTRTAADGSVVSVTTVELTLEPLQVLFLVAAAAD